ncbi:hypothetical protein [Actinomadura macrotermitis]|uniref:Uncharacterized protein n=1 Tax=Actinomadura macrotermitis TaxID=2585200 RepID=A0A7K0C306_9ACTN|nr:hypothetical protein [Actinomadura macrotermitis]MQY07746.1 hypothetical protein [Actinomadura macrotermitis]
MPDVYEVDAVERCTVGQVECWRVAYRRPDGGLTGYVFPVETLEWRAAEYGIDPADVTTLLDIVLHEPFIPDPTDPASFAGDAAAAKGMTVPAAASGDRVAEGDPVPVWLYNAETIEQARAAHLARVAAVKRDRVRVATAARTGARAAADPLKAIHARAVDPAAVKAKAEVVAALRERVRAEARLRDEGGDR